MGKGTDARRHSRQDKMVNREALKSLDNEERNRHKQAQQAGQQ